MAAKKLPFFFFMVTTWYVLSGDNMKKWSILLFFMILLVPVSLKSNSVFFTWYDTDIDISLGEPLEPYLLIPYAKLNEPNEDPNIYYEKNGVNYTYQSVIQTSVVKTYRLDFRVYSPKYRVSSVHTIIFRVIDDTPPIFEKVPLLDVPVFTKTVDYTLGLRYSDNYSNPSNMSLSVDTNAVNLNQVGVYQVLYTLTDEFGNESKTTAYVRVRDYFAPVITQTKPLILNINTTLNLSDFFIIKDNYDTIVNTIIHDKLVDYAAEGIYPISIELYDQSGNQTKLETTIEIKDQIPPELFLKTTVLKLSKDTTFDLKTLIIKVLDNHQPLSVDDVMITTDLDLTKVGFYEALFEVTDKSDLLTSLKVDIFVEYKEKPIIHYDKLIIEKDIPYHLLSGITYNEDMRYDITVLDSNVLNQAGTYEVIYLVIDPLGNHAIYHREVIMEDDSIVDLLPLLTVGIGITLLGACYAGYWIWKKRQI